VVKITFEHLPGRRAAGTVEEILADGSFLVRPERVPKPWRWDDENDPRMGRIAPEFFLVDFNPRSAVHRRLHGEFGYRYDPGEYGIGLAERIQRITAARRGVSIRSHEWYTQRIREAGLPIEDGFHTFWLLDYQAGDRFRTAYFTIGTSVYHGEEGRFYRLVEDQRVEVEEILRAPGRILTAVFNPYDRNRLYVSAEGYPHEDPRWQCLYELDLPSGDYWVIEFPKPAGNDLYGSKINFFLEEGVALLNRYGFVPEGGGLWLMGINRPDYEPKRQLLAWDHSQSWMFFPTSDPGVLTVFFTAKEVDNHMTMTVNRAKLHLAGEDTYLTEPRRIAKVRGWNPIPWRVEPLNGYRYRVLVASNEYQNYMAGYPMGVYPVEVGEE